MNTPGLLKPRFVSGIFSKFYRTIIHSTTPAVRLKQQIQKRMENLKEKLDSDVITNGGRNQCFQEGCIFCSIATGKDNKNKVIFQNSEVSVFYDIRPAAKQHLLIIPKTHLKTAKTLSEEDIPKVKYMYEVGRSVLKELRGNMEDTRCGFHWPPFHSIEHLHLHMIHKENEMNFIQRQIFKPNSFWFVTYDWVIDWLERKKSLKEQESTQDFTS